MTTAMGVGIPALASVGAIVVGRALGYSLTSGFNLPFLYAQHGIQLLFALAAIAIVRRWVPADYGLHLPRGKTYYAPAIAWGAAFAVIMTLIGDAPLILAHKAPTLDYPLTMRNIAGWLIFEGVYVGPCEEIPFRALMVTFLTATMPGKIRAASFEMNRAGIVVAVIFALLHINTFWQAPWPIALGQQVYAFALGVLYAYWLEKSASVAAPILAHNLADGLSFCIMYTWVWLATS
jgi:membrane protease YdiL (CAAX protease family)